MKLITFLAFFEIAFATVSGQNKFIFSKDSDTVFWYGQKNEYARQFQLDLIENNKSTHVFRIWVPGEIIKVETTDSIFSGDITLFVEDNSDAKKTFKKKYIISPNQARKTLDLINSMQIENLPSDNQIKNWKKENMDGTTLFIEYKKGNQYSFKTYFVPERQDTLNEAVILMNFFNNVRLEINTAFFNKDFLDHVPFSSWSSPGSRTIISKVKD